MTYKISYEGRTDYLFVLLEGPDSHIGEALEG